MFNENEKFEFNIGNMKQDFAMENMTISNEQVDMLKQFENGNISMSQILDDIKLKYGE